MADLFKNSGSLDLSPINNGDNLPSFQSGGKKGTTLTPAQAKQYWQQLQTYRRQYGDENFNKYPVSKWFYDYAPNSNRSIDSSDLGEFVDDMGMAAAQLMLAPMQAGQSAMVEGVEALRGNDYSFSPESLLDITKQRTPSKTFLKDSNKYVQFAGDMLFDPSLVLGVGSKLKGNYNYWKNMSKFNPQWTANNPAQVASLPLRKRIEKNINPRGYGVKEKIKQFVNPSVRNSSFAPASKTSPRSQAFRKYLGVSDKKDDYYLSTTENNVFNISDKYIQKLGIHNKIKNNLQAKRLLSSENIKHDVSMLPVEDTMGNFTANVKHNSINYNDTWNITPFKGSYSIEKGGYQNLKTNKKYLQSLKDFKENNTMFFGDTKIVPTNLEYVNSQKEVLGGNLKRYIQKNLADLDPSQFIPGAKPFTVEGTFNYQKGGSTTKDYFYDNANISPDSLDMLMNSIRQHESYNNYQQEQIGGGPGSGAYQIEGTTLPTLIDKAYKLTKNPRYKDLDVENASQLSPEMQDELMLMNFVRRDNKMNYNIPDLRFNTKEDMGQLWQKYHNRASNPKTLSKYVKDLNTVPNLDKYVMERGGLQKTQPSIFDNNGFLDINKSNHTPIKVIQGGDITMKGVSKDIMAFPVSKGKLKNPTLMKPNKNYNFDSDYVIEIPKFQYAGLMPLLPNADPLSTPETFNVTGNLFQQQRARNLNNIQTPYLQGNEFDVDGDGAPNYIDNRDELSGIYGANQPENIYDDYTYAPGAGQQQRSGTSDFARFLSENPAAYSGVDLNTALFRAGQSFGFDADILENEDARRRARNGNLLRGVGAVGKSVLNIGRLVGAGLGYQNRLNDFQEDYMQQRREGIVGNYRFKKGGLFQFFKNGGKVSDLTKEQALTGEFITGLPENAQGSANAELEKGEYVQHPNTDVQKVVGNTHGNGGEKMNLEQGTMIISNHLKIGGDFAKILRKEFDISTKAKDTYSSTIDKYTSKIGLKKLNEEQEQLFTKLSKEEETKDESTANLNRQFLSSRIKEIEDEKAPLLEQRKQFLNMIFEEQEVNKTAEEKVPQFEKGGRFSTKEFKTLCKKHGISEEEGMSLVSSFKYGGKKKKVPKYQTAGFSLLQNSFNTEDLSPRQRQRFSSFGTANTSGNVNSQEALNERVLELIRLNPSLAPSVFGNPESGLNINQGSITNFQTGFNENASAIIEFVNSSDEFSDEQKASIVNSIEQEVFVEDGEATARRSDGILGNFTSSRPGFLFDTVTPTDLERLKSQGITSYKQLLNTDGTIDPDLNLSQTSINALQRFNDFDGNFLLGTVNEPEIQSLPEVEVVASRVVEEEPKAPPASPDPNADIAAIQRQAAALRGSGMLAFPDQSVIPPNAVTPALKIERQYERLDPFALTNEDNLKEIFRQQNFAAGQLENLPDSQRRAVLATMTANSQEVANQSVTQTNIANAQNLQQTEQFNIGQSNMEENARAADLLDFERRQMTALANTEEDLSNYFDFNRRQRMMRFQNTQRQALLNGIYENFNVSPFGTVDFDPTQSTSFATNPSL